jgi:hypothetical protein
MFHLLSMMMPPTTSFEIKVAVIGGKSNIKNAALNALFGDKYLPEDSSLKETKASVFRVVSGLKEGRVKIQTASSVHTDILIHQQNKADTATTMEEFNFDICPRNKLAQELRDDVSFVFVNLPAIDPSNKTSPVGKYLSDTWETFDRAIVVVDPLEDSEAEYAQIFDLVKNLSKKKKHIPVIILCNEMETCADEGDIRRRIQKFEAHVESIKQSLTPYQKTSIPSVSVRSIGILSYDSDDEEEVQATITNKLDIDSLKQTQSSVIDFISASIRTAFVLQMAEESELTLDMVKGLDNRSLNHVGLTLLGEKKWSPLMNLQEERKYEMLFELLNSSYVDCDFDAVVRKVQNLVGNYDAQAKLLEEQKCMSLDRLSSGTNFAKNLHSICKKYKSLEDNFVATCVEHFWILYPDCEAGAFAKFEREMNPSRLALPLEQLSDFKIWMEEEGLLGREKARLNATLTGLVKRQLHMILHKNSTWSFDDWYSKMNTHEWRKLPGQEWDQLSPSDWCTIISSVLLSSSDSYFYEAFGKEKIALERAKLVSNDRFLKPDQPSKQGKKFSAADGCPSLEHSLDGSYDKGKFRPKYPETFECVVRFEVPEKLSNKSHWGHVPWKYCIIVRSFRE